MDNVKDVCSYNPQRYQVFLSITSAPESDAEAVFKIYFPFYVPNYQTRLDLLRKQVLLEKWPTVHLTGAIEYADSTSAED